MSDRCIHNRCRRPVAFTHVSRFYALPLCGYHWQRFCEAEQRREEEQWNDPQVRRAVVEGVLRDVEGTP